MKLWERYFLREIWKTFFFVLISFFSLYSIFDYSTHMDDFFRDKKLQIDTLLHYYSSHFLKRCDFLLPLALLIATIKVLTTLNLRREWIVFQVAGLTTKKLLRPFLLSALVCTLFNWTNFQFLLPTALNQIDAFEASHFKHSHRAQRAELLHLLTLKDTSKLIYQNYDKEKHAFFDVLWIRSTDDIWRIKYLAADPAKPIGEYVDHLIRNEQGLMEKAASYDRYTLSDLKWHPKLLGKAFIPFENRSIKELVKLSLSQTGVSPYELPKITTQIWFKVIMPLLSLLAVIAIAPFCIRFSRNTALFLIYAIALFSLFAFYTLVDSTVIIGQHGALPPLIAISAPFILFGSIFTYKLIKTT